MASIYYFNFALYEHNKNITIRNKALSTREK